MKHSFRLFLSFVVFGLFSQTSSAQSITETDTIQFHYPLEVGNVWVYSYRTPAPGSSCFMSGCDYQRWEVVSTDTSPEKGSCGIIIAKQIYSSVVQSTFELCMNDNQLTRYPASDRGWPILNGTEESELLADFNKAEGEGWLTGFLFQNRALWKEFHDNHDGRFNQRTFIILENGEKEYLADYNGIYQHSFLQGQGFLSHGFYETSNYIDLTGSFLNGVLTGDTTFVYTTSIDDVPHPERSEGPMLLSTYPNPFNPTTVIGYRLAVSGRTQISVYNPLGQRVAILLDGVQAPGQHSVTFDAAGLPSGMYVIVLEAAGMRDVRKVTLLK